jgi:hypothetical protein
MYEPTKRRMEMAKITGSWDMSFSAEVHISEEEIARRMEELGEDRDGAIDDILLEYTLEELLEVGTSPFGEADLVGWTEDEE